MGERTEQEQGGWSVRWRADESLVDGEIPCGELEDEGRGFVVQSSFPRGNLPSFG